MKARNRKTGETVDVISWTPKREIDFVSYVDSKGIEYEKRTQSFYRDFEIINYIDSEQQRFELAKAAMQGILSNQHQVDFALSRADYGDGKCECSRAIAQFAIACADALIAELKK